MVKVPVYERDVRLTPIHRQGVDIRATPQAFGSDIGAGMQQVGKGLGDLAASVKAVKDLEDETLVRQRRNQYMQERDTLMYDPESGYMNTSGKNAMDQRGVFNDNMRKVREKYANGLTPAQQSLFDKSIETLELDSKRSAMVHNGAELKRFVVSEGNAAAENFRQEALRNVNNPAMADKYLSAAINELREVARKQGVSGEVLDVEERKFLSDSRYNAAMLLAAKDPLQAQAYHDKYKDQFSVEQSHKFQQDIKTPLLNAKVQQNAARFQGMTRDAPAAGSGGLSGGERPATGGGPTRAKAFLHSRSAHKDRPGDTTNLDNNFADNLAALMQDAPAEIRDGLGLGSAYRDNETQKRLFANSDGSGKMVAFPAGAKKPDGSIARGSNHLHGRAVDLTYNGMRLDKAPANVREWVHQNAGRYGLHFPMSWEPWHIEPTGTRGSTVQPSGGGVSPRTGMPSFDQMESFLSTINDPMEREATRKALIGGMETRVKLFEMQQKEARSQAFNLIETQGMNPFNLPPEISTQIGMEGVSALMTYWEKKQTGEKIETDPTFRYNLDQYAASDRENFAKEDLTQIFHLLGKEDRERYTKIQTDFATDSQKSLREGAAIKLAIDQSKTALEAVGITMTGTKEEDRTEAARRIAMFNQAITAEVEAFQRMNERVPTYAETQQMIMRQLLPVVIRESGERSVWNPLKTPWSKDWTTERKGFMFESGNRLDNSEVEIAVEYKDIPIQMRSGIAVDLERELGRKPSEAEIVTRYETFMATR